MIQTMNAAEVCEALQITRKTLQRWERDGKIPFTYVGRKHIYLAEDVERMIYQHYRK